MDECVEYIASQVHALRFADLSASVIHHCKRSVIDSFAVALGAFDADASELGRRMAQRCRVDSGARVMGTGHRTLPELAAFANGIMVRYLDANDSFVGGGGHPSDSIAAILAAADLAGADGRTIVTAIVIAYEVYYSLGKSPGLRERGLDNALYAAVAGAAGAAKVLGLDKKGITHAISLAITANIPLTATRYGALSMWKGCAGGNAARNGVFAALLAAQGMTGPEKPIEGDHGLRHLIGEFQLAPFADAGRRYAITRVTFKSFASVSHAMSPITVALELSRDVAVEDIAEVNVHTYHYAWEVAGREPEKWRPATREAADHSLPYIVSAVLIDGAFSLDMFSQKRLQDPRILQLIDKVKIIDDAELTSRFPQSIPCRTEILMKNGDRKVAQIDYPPGHERNPMSDDDVREKFRSHARRLLQPEQVESSLAALWKLDEVPNLDGIFAAVQVA